MPYLMRLAIHKMMILINRLIGYKIWKKGKEGKIYR